MSFTQIIELIIGCITVDMFVHDMQHYKSGLYKSISACTYLLFLVFIASDFSGLSNVFTSILIVKWCSIGLFFIALYGLHTLKKHSKQIIQKNNQQLIKNMQKIHNNDKEFSMKDAKELRKNAKELRQSVLNSNSMQEEQIVHHILMQNDKYHQHFMISIHVLSHCIDMSEHDIKKAIRDAFHNHPQALNKINTKIQKYDSLHPSNTFLDRINKAEQNSNSSH